MDAHTKTAAGITLWFGYFILHRGSPHPFMQDMVHVLGECETIAFRTRLLASEPSPIYEIQISRKVILTGPLTKGLSTNDIQLFSGPAGSCHRMKEVVRMRIAERNRDPNFVHVDFEKI